MERYPQLNGEKRGGLAGKLWVKYPELPEGIDDPEKLTLEQIQAL